MKIGSYKYLTTLLACMLMSPLVAAQDYMSSPEYGYRESVPESYGRTFGRKMGSGASNMAMGWIEIPKNTINLSNDVDTEYVLFGLIGGIIKGTLHTVGRTLTGVSDFVTAPVPTKSMIRPDYVWDKFSEDTTYGPYYQLTDSPRDVERAQRPE